MEPVISDIPLPGPEWSGHLPTDQLNYEHLRQQLREERKRKTATQVRHEQREKEAGMRIVHSGPCECTGCRQKREETQWSQHRNRQEVLLDMAEKESREAEAGRAAVLAELKESNRIANVHTKLLETIAERCRA